MYRKCEDAFNTYDNNIKAIIKLYSMYRSAAQHFYVLKKKKKKVKS